MPILLLTIFIRSLVLLEAFVVCVALWTLYQNGLEAIYIREKVLLFAGGAVGAVPTALLATFAVWLERRLLQPKRPRP